MHFSEKFILECSNNGMVYLSVAVDDHIVEEYRISVEEWLKMFSFVLSGLNYKSETLSVKKIGKRYNIVFTVGDGYRKGFNCSESEFKSLSAMFNTSFPVGVSVSSDSLVVDETSKSEGSKMYQLQVALEDSLRRIEGNLLKKIAELSIQIDSKIENIKLPQVSDFVQLSQLNNLEEGVSISNRSLSVESTEFELDFQDDLFIPSSIGSDFIGNVVTSNTLSTESADAAAEALKKLRSNDD